MRKLFGFVAVVITGLSSSIAAADPCAIDLAGADHLWALHAKAMAEAVGQIGSSLQASTPRRLRAHYVKIFGPDEIRAALRASGVPADTEDAISKRIDKAVQRAYATRAEDVPVILNSLEFLLDVHGARESKFNLCVMEAGCPEFHLRGLNRPFLTVSRLGSVHVLPLTQGAVASGEVASPFHFNVVALRPGGDPDLFVADMFSGLGAAAFAHVARLWAYSRIAERERASDRLFSRYGRIVKGHVYLDSAFLEFVATMAGHVALREYVKLMPMAVSPNNLRHPGRLTTVAGAFATMSPDTIASLRVAGVTPENAVATFEAWFDHMRTRINILNPGGPN